MLEPVTAADCRLLLSLLKFAIVAPDQRERVQSALEQEMACAERWEAIPVAPPEPHPTRATLTFEQVRKLALQTFMQENVLAKGLDETGHERN
jgi:hypothetical protein